MKDKPSKLDGYEEALEQWFGVEKITLAEARERLSAQGLTVSIGRLSQWWEDYSTRRAQERLLAQIATGAKNCKAVEKQLEANQAPELEMLIRLHRMLILQLTTAGAGNPEILDTVNRMMKPVLAFSKQQMERKALELDERRVTLLEEKAAQADQAAAVAGDKGMSAEEKTAKMREIFGIA